MPISLPAVALGSILKMRRCRITIICIKICGKILATPRLLSITLTLIAIGDKLHVAHVVYPALNMQELVIDVV